MRSHVIIVDRYQRQHLQAAPGTLFVFGDNMAGFGKGGQARECRGEPNAVGIPTKWRPTKEVDAYFSDDAMPRIKPILQGRFRQLSAHLAQGGNVVWPADGVGSGLAELRTKAPAIDAYITKCFKHLCAIASATRRAKTLKAVECKAWQSGGGAASPNTGSGERHAR